MPAAARGAKLSLCDAAARGCALSVVQLLREGRVYVDDDENLGQAPLHFAAERGHAACVKLLLKHGADVNLRDRCRETALVWAARNGHADVVALLLDAGASLKRARCETPLHYAAENGHADVVALLVDAAECDVDWRPRGSSGRTALHWGAGAGHVDAVALLVRAGADVELADDEGRTALGYAAFDSRAGVVDQLLRLGAATRSLSRRERRFVRSRERVIRRVWWVLVAARRRWPAWMARAVGELL